MTLTDLLVMYAQELVIHWHLVVIFDSQPLLPMHLSDNPNKALIHLQLSKYVQDHLDPKIPHFLPPLTEQYHLQALE